MSRQKRARLAAQNADPSLCRCSTGCTATHGSAIDPDGPLCDMCEAEGCETR